MKIKRKPINKLGRVEAELLRMRLRQENSVAHHKAYMEEYKMREAIKAAETIRNMQNQWGSLREAHERLPIALQGPAALSMRALQEQRIKLMEADLKDYKAKYPHNFPRV